MTTTASRAGRLPRHRQSITHLLCALALGGAVVALVAIVSAVVAGI